MKKIISVFIAILVSFMLTSCNSDAKKESSKQGDDPILIKDHAFGLDSIGTFYRYRKAENVRTFKTGPIIVEIEAAETVQGRITTEFRTSDDTIYNPMELVNVHIQFKLNKEVNDNISFNNEKHLHLKTNTGEMIKQPDQFMSSVLNISTLKNTQETGMDSHLRQFTFLLKKTTAKELKNATLLIDAPVNRSGDSLGKDLEIEIDFHTDNS
ncbi:hypothetical protein [Virgibacillus halodenitrificans]|uniref:hypothetical protein n=1 Tax=Virgibacillus halodenitrificans TaxID=1482 RepID=UPI001F46992A|nr:hypothetical protein [Virgibacillus halodenitrificans]